MTGPSIQAGEIAYDFVARDRASPVAERVARSVRDAGAGAGESSAGIGRFGTALERMERREPTMVLRQLRGEVVALGAEATGVGGPIGHLATTMAMFGVGGAAGLVAIGGFAAIGAGIKALIDYTGSLDTNLAKVNAKFAVMVPMAKGFAEIGQTRKTIEDLSGRSFMSKFLRTDIGGVGIGIPGLTDVATAMDVSRQSEQATESNILSLQLAQQRKQREAIVARRTGAPTAEAGLETRAKEMRSFAEAAELSAAKLQLAKQGITDVSDPRYADRIEAIKAKFAGITGGVAELGRKAREAADNAEILAATLERTAEGVVSAGVVFGPRTHGRRLTSGNVATGPLAAQKGNAGLITASAEAMPEGAGVGIMGVAGRTAGIAGESPMAQAAREAATKGEAKASELAGKAIGELFAHMAAAATAGSGRAGQVMAQAVTTLLAGLGESLAKSLTKNMDPKSFAASAVPGFIGAGVGILGGLLGGLFGSHAEPTVMISGYSSKALTQQQQIMLALTGFKGLNIDILSAGGRDVSSAMYELGRQGRTDGTLRLPPGASRAA